MYLNIVIFSILKKYTFFYYNNSITKYVETRWLRFSVLVHEEYLESKRKKKKTNIPKNFFVCHFFVSHKEGLEKDVEKLKHYTDMETHIFR